MIKKLQKKMVITNVLIVGVILTIVFALYISAVHRVDIRSITRDLRSTVYLTSGHDHEIIGYANPTGGFEPFPDGGDFGGQPGGEPENPDEILEYPKLDAEVIRVDEDNKVESINTQGLELESSDLDTIASRVNTEDFNTLFEVDGYDLFAYKFNKFHKTYIGLTDSSDFHEVMRGHYIRAAALWAGFNVLFLILSVIISSWAIRPVKESWIKQQQFISDASHELKTPLTVIMANDNILLSPESELSEDNRKWVESIQEESEHMQTLVEKMLFLAKNDSEEMPVVKESVKFSESLEEDVLQFDPVAFERRIRIEDDITPGIELTADRTQLRMLSHILLENACKYADDDSVIEVSLKPTKDGCTLSVHNIGNPIPEEDLPNVFERFYRADKARTFTEKSQGFGLGLAIAKAVCENHNGDISVTSSAKNGTTFTAKLSNMQ